LAVPLRLRASVAYKACVRRLTEHDTHVRPLATQKPSDADERAPGAAAGDEHRKALASKIAQNLARLRRLVDVGVRLCFELVGEEPAVRRGEFDGLLIHPKAFELARHEDDFGAEHAHELATLAAQVQSVRSPKDFARWTWSTL
jgi:hypothetical protein